MDLRLHNLIVVDQLQKTMQFYNLKFRISWQCSFQTKSIMTPGAADPAAYLIRGFVATSSGANAIFWKDWLMNSWDSGQGYSKHAASGRLLRILYSMGTKLPRGSILKHQKLWSWSSLTFNFIQPSIFAQHASVKSSHIISNEPLPKGQLVFCCKSYTTTFYRGGCNIL